MTHFLIAVTLRIKDPAPVPGMSCCSSSPSKSPNGLDAPRLQQTIGLPWPEYSMTGDGLFEDVVYFECLVATTATSCTQFSLPAFLVGGSQGTSWSLHAVTALRRMQK